MHNKLSAYKVGTGKDAFAKNIDVEANFENLLFHILRGPDIALSCLYCVMNLFGRYGLFQKPD